MPRNNRGIEEYVWAFAHDLKEAIGGLPEEIKSVIHGVDVMAPVRESSHYGDIYSGRNAAATRDEQGKLKPDYASIRVLRVAEGNFGRHGMVLVGIRSDDPGWSPTRKEQAAHDAVVDLAWRLKRGEISGSGCHPDIFIV